MSVSSISTPTTILTTLAQTASSATQLSTQVEVDQVNGQIQKQLNQKIAALKNNNSGDSVLIKVTQSQIAQLQKQLSTINTHETQYGENGNLLSDIQTQLAHMQTAIANGDSTYFDSALLAANSDVGNLLVVSPTAPFQPDQILPLKATGLGIESSATYDLSTAAGQATAKTAVGNAQTLINQIFQYTTDNQLVAGSLSAAMSSQINTLNKTLQQTQSTAQDQITSQTAKLTQLAQNQEHLIQLALGNSTQLSDALGQMATIPTLPNSPFAVLLNSVGSGSSSSSSSASTPAILSLLA